MKRLDNNFDKSPDPYLERLANKMHKRYRRRALGKLWAAFDFLARFLGKDKGK